MKTLLKTMLIVLILLSCPLSFAEEGEWEFYASPALWGAGVDTKLQAGTVTVEGEMKFADIIKDLKGSLMGSFGAKKDKFSLDVTMLAIALEDELPTLILSGSRNTEITQVYVQALLGYELFEVPIGDTMELSITPRVGPRNYWNRFRIDRLGGGELRDITTQWTDFVAGGKLTLDVNEKISLLLEGDAGGFGWGSSSDLAWTVGGFVNYHLSDRTTLKAGYFHLDIDKDRSSQFGGGSIQIQMGGPVLGAIFNF